MCRVTHLRTNLGGANRLVRRKFWSNVLLSMAYNKKKKKLKTKKNRQTKTVLSFDEKARKEYLTGFKKRKDERRKKAQEQVERMIKEERKKMKQKAKEFREHAERNHQSVPTDLEQIVSKQVTELPEHTVTITDISEIDLAGHAGTRLGLNKVQESDSEDDGRDDDIDDVKSTPEVSIHKHERAMKKIKDKIHKTSKHLKQKSHQRKCRRTLSKKAKHKMKFQNQ